MKSGREDTQRQTVLIVDDEPTNIQLLVAILRQRPSISVLYTTDATKALDLVDGSSPDLVLLDLMMPGIDGYGILEQLRSPERDCGFLPVLVLTADTTREAIHRCLASGATDFLTKPFDPMEVLLRIDNLLHARRLHCQLEHHNSELEGRVSERTEELERAKLEILDRLARTTEYRDDQTGRHIMRVGRNSRLLWTKLGLPDEGAELIEQAARLHDVGKVAVPDAILLKPEKLTGEEFEALREHSQIGSAILGGSLFPILQMGERIARWHHERWDGQGYPDGLSGTDIPIEARIVHVCDIFDALINQRPYKRAWAFEDAVEEIRRSSGRSADPEVVAAFIELGEEGCITA